MPSYKLFYHDMRGLGEVIRLLFALADVPYEDVRVHCWSEDEWEKFKPKTLFGQLPVVEIDGRIITQPYAIYRYLANEFGFAGKDPWENQLIDAIGEAQKGMYPHFLDYYGVMLGVDDGDPETVFSQRVKPLTDSHFPTLVKLLKESGSGFFVKSGLTWIDLVISEEVSTLRNFKPDILEDYPELEEHIAKVHAVPTIQAWHKVKPPKSH